MSKYEYRESQILIGQIFSEEKEMRIVAGPKLARQARQILELDRIRKRDKTPDEQSRERMRITAVNFVINEGVVYEPILIRYEEQKVREGGTSDLVDRDDVF